MNKIFRSVGTLLIFVLVVGLGTTACNKGKRVMSATAQYSAPSRAKAPLTEAAVTEVLQKVLAGLPENMIQFFPPPTMTMNEKIGAEARMARPLLENINRALLTKDWKVDALVGAHLSGDNFEFRSTGPEDQMVGSQELTAWTWDVTPLAAGPQILKLNMTLRVVTASGAQYKALPVLERQVQVLEKRSGGFLKFLQEFWMWILGVVLVAGIVAILVIEPSNKANKKT